MIVSCAPDPPILPVSRSYPYSSPGPPFRDSPFSPRRVFRFLTVGEVEGRGGRCSGDLFSSGFCSQKPRVRVNFSTRPPFPGESILVLFVLSSIRSHGFSSSAFCLPLGERLIAALKNTILFERFVTYKIYTIV